MSTTGGHAVLDFHEQGQYKEKSSRLVVWGVLCQAHPWSSIKRKRGRKITEDALNDSMRMKCEESIWPANLATLQWTLVRKAMSTRCIGAWCCFTFRRNFQTWTPKRGQFN
ncbi:Coiled-coil domain-containing protein [Trichinella spiralis]|uniref:Coiled-coil domain-containing protein n=1 Tax=Trichinella spiralis TaxID=6334 RepID=A0ABR3KRR4_TRISP